MNGLQRQGSWWPQPHGVTSCTREERQAGLALVSKRNAPRSRIRVTSASRLVFRHETDDTKGHRTASVEALDGRFLVVVQEGDQRVDVLLRPVNPLYIRFAAAECSGSDRFVDLLKLPWVVMARPSKNLIAARSYDGE